jgi:archaellum biogenesis ATPase FlaH
MASVTVARKDFDTGSEWEALYKPVSIIDRESISVAADCMHKLIENKDYKALIIARDPEVLKTTLIVEYSLEDYESDIETYTLTSKPQDRNISPGSSKSLFSTMIQSIEENKRTIILLDGLEYVLQHSGSDMVRNTFDEFLDNIPRDRTAMVLIPVVEEALPKEDLDYMIRQTKSVRFSCQ